MNASDHSQDRLAAGEVRDRATGGAALLGARGLLIYVLATCANLALARLLTPRDFGVFALGLVLVVLGTYVAEGGFGGALIRRDEEPEDSELEAVAGLQLGATALVVLVMAAVAVPLGRDAEVIALMAVSLPIAMLRAPSVIVLERRLDYRVIAAADLVEAIVFYVLAIALVAAGLGVWGIAGAIVARATAGSAVVLARGPLGLVRPRWAWSRVRPLLGFGARFQGAAVALIAREQLLNVGVGAVAGLATLGVWTLAWRVLQVPNLLFQTVGRVAFPAISRLLGAGREVGPLLERQVATIAAVNAVVVVGVVGLSPALPEVVGDDWGEVPEVLLWSGVALIIGAPVASTAVAYLFAANEPGRVLVAAVASAAVWLAVALPLLEPVGPAAVGIGWIAAALVNGAMTWPRAAARTGASLAHMAVPTALALGALAIAWGVGQQQDERLVGGTLGLLAGEVVVFASLLAASRPALQEVRGLVRQAIRR